MCVLTKYKNVIPDMKKTRRKSKEKYKTFNSSLRFEIGKYEAENSNKQAVDRDQVKESTVRSFKVKYLALQKSFAKSVLAQSSSSAENTSAVAVLSKYIPLKKRGRKSLLGEEMDDQLHQYVLQLRVWSLREWHYC